MVTFFRHLFLPRSSNNHRPKVLHHDFLFVLIIVLMVAQLSFLFVKTEHPQVLGALTDVSSEELLAITNVDRAKEGKAPLQLNSELSTAAHLKAKDMFAKNYWAHFGPDGTTPWQFFKASGYQYVYAGENLARGFTTTEDVVDAWMKSPSHRENMLSGNYQDVGFAVEKGSLSGENTILVVELFGGKTTAVAKSPRIAANPRSSSNLESFVRSATSVHNKPLINSTSVAYVVTLSILGILVLVFLVDLILIKKRKIVRLVGHNMDHIFFLGGIIVFIILYVNGVIL